MGKPIKISDLAQKMIDLSGKEYLKINLDSLLNDKKILGSEYFTEEFIKNYLKVYVLDISPKLK